MKTDANWFGKCGLLLVLLTVFVASCGGGGKMNLGSASNQPGVTPTTNSGAVHVITDPSQIATLPQDEQALLNDPGWNQPYIAAPEGTKLPMPSYDELMRLTRERLANGDTLAPRGTESGGGKSTSWTGQGSDAYQNVSPPYGGANNVPAYDTLATVLKGEYYQFGKSATPTYGCNADGTNIGNRPGPNAIEDTLAQFNLANLGAANQAICYVLEAISKPNWFNTGGGTGGPGTGGNARCAIYQIWSRSRTANPANPQTGDVFGETSFRSDLTQYGKGPGQGVGAGGTQCYIGAAIAHGISGDFWRVFNTVNTAQPNLQGISNYQILIAPSNEAQGVGVAGTDFTSTDNSKVVWQGFYFGSVSLCYGGAQIVGLTSSTSSCQAFKDIFTQKPGFFYNPVYGTVLKQWQAMAPASALDKPWKGPLGAPVFGPTAYNNGSKTSEPNKSWYAWGWYFERGFMWYVDNDQTQFPNTPDEAQVYVYSGNNTYCSGGTYTQLKPSSFFLGPNLNTFKVNVGVTGFSGDNTTFLAPSFNSALTPARYQVPMKANGPNPGDGEQVFISAAASGYGGTPDANCNYASYVWAWRDGTIEVVQDGVLGKNRTHLYSGPKAGQSGVNKQSLYVIRVQCKDSTGAIAYGDSLPIELGTSPVGGGTEVLLLRNDGGAGNFDANYNAIKADLDLIKAANANFTYTELNYTTGGAAFVTSAKTNKVIIWYRGGPTAATPLNNQVWTAQQVADAQAIMAAPNPRPIVYMTQNLAINGTTSNIFGALGWEGGGTPAVAVTAPGYTADTFLMALTGTHAVDNNQGFPGLVPVSFVPFTTNGNNTVNFDANAAEKYGSTGSSGKIPTAGLAGSIVIGHQTTFTNPAQFSVPSQPATFLQGLGVLQAWNVPPGAFISFGNSAAGQKCYVVGYSWAALANNITAGNPSIPTTANILLNILAAQDSTVGSAPTGPPPFSRYSGAAEILQVTPMQFKSDGSFVQGNSVTPGINAGQFPDSQFTANTTGNVYRGTIPTPAGFIGQTAVRNYTPAEDDAYNGNDLAFDGPLYAYILDTNNTVNSGAFTLDGTETFTFGGLMITNNGTWTRVNPNTTAAKTWSNLLATNAALNNTYGNGARLPVAGYYVSTTTANFGGTFLMASYGTTQADMIFNNVDGKVTLESIAHWDPSLLYGASPVNVMWKVWPGHGTANVSSGAVNGIYGEGAILASQYFNDTDIDPGVTPTAPRPLRTDKRFNASSYNAGQTAEGRVMEFGFGSVRGWDGDLNRNGVRGEDPADKFPVECRIFSNFNVYNEYFNNGWTYPNNVPRATSFVEAGCYLVDKGPRVQGITVLDDGVATNDPGTAGNPVNNPSANNFTTSFAFKITGSAPPITKLEFNPNFTGAGVWQDITANVAGGMPGDGTFTATNVAFTQAFSPPTYVFALRATDSLGVSAPFFWPGAITLAPPALLVENFNSLSLSAAKWQPSYNGNFGNDSPLIASATNYAGSGSYFSFGSVAPQEGAGFLRLTTQLADNFGNGGYSVLRSQTIPCNNAQTYNISFWTNGSGEGGFARIIFATSFNAGASWTFPTLNPGFQSLGFWQNSFTPWFGSPAPSGYVANSGPGWNGQSAGAWCNRTGTQVSTGTQFQCAFIYDDDIFAGYPGPAWDNLLIN